jgi:hypothetical protein
VHVLDLLEGQLASAGEQLLITAAVFQVATGVTARPSVGPASVQGGLAVGQGIARIGAVRGASSSLARGIPLSRGMTVMAVTDRHLSVWPLLVDGRRTDPGWSGGPVQPVWAVERSSIAGIERRPRLQLRARFRLHFVDQSWMAYMTGRRRHIEALAAVLGNSR